MEKQKLQHMRLAEELKASELCYQQSIQTEKIKEAYNARKLMSEEAAAASERDMQQRGKRLRSLEPGF